MKLAVLGYGAEGQTAHRYWQGLGHQITICDASPDLKLPPGLPSQLGVSYLRNLSQFDLIVRSPGVRPQFIFKANPGLDAAKITTGTNEFLANCPAPVIGVTGTKGKGTTSTLIAHMLEAAGQTVHLGGNIGRPALSFLADVKPDDWVVLELSSFQLIDARRSPQVGVMLMIAPDHQNWHPDMGEYVTAKQNIFAHQQPGDRAIYNACNIYSLRAGLGAPADQQPYNAESGAHIDGDQLKIGSTIICKTADIGLVGRHNWDNVCAAVTATWPIVRDAAPICQAIRDFTGLEHRLETVATIAGVTYINDSYSSSIGPTLAALEAFAQPKVLIIGGYDKQQSFEGLAKRIASSNVRQVIVVGAVTAQVAAALDQAGFSDYTLGAADMTEIVAAAAQAAQPGDVVLLSPGTSSFDMFKNFQQRGEHFKQAVARLAEHTP